MRNSRPLRNKFIKISVGLFVVAWISVISVWYIMSISELHAEQEKKEKIDLVNEVTEQKNPFSNKKGDRIPDAFPTFAGNGEENKANYEDIVAPNDKKISNNVQIFYYPWYGNLKHDGVYMHWTHEVLEGDEGSRKILSPPEKIGTNFYPYHGLYSSNCTDTISRQMKEISDMGIGVIITSWNPPETSDRQCVLAGKTGYTNDILHKLLNIANQYSLKVALHLEPYEGRTAYSVESVLLDFLGKFGNHNALYRINGKVVVYVYDSYEISASDWSRVLSVGSSLREAEIVVIGLLVNLNDKNKIIESKFDGIYTYFGATGFTQGSTITSWKGIVRWAEQNNLLSMLCVSPGYDDTFIRPWNSVNKRNRDSGEYYNNMWKSAIEANPSFVGITSYNEWGEGTQIEAAMSLDQEASDERNEMGEMVLNSLDGFSDYRPLNPFWYLEATAEHVKSWVYD